MEISLFLEYQQRQLIVQKVGEMSLKREISKFQMRDDFFFLQKF